MCKIRTGEEVKHRGNLQNVITGMILRQTGVFTKDTILPALQKVGIFTSKLRFSY